MKLNNFFQILFFLVFNITLGISAPAEANVGDLVSRDQLPGCSSSGECCLVQFNTAGCGHDSVQFVGVDPNSGCKTLIIGMYAAWISECTGHFEGCYLYKEANCGGQGAYYLYNNQGQCANPGFTIVSVRCFGNFK